MNPTHKNEFKPTYWKMLKKHGLEQLRPNPRRDVYGTAVVRKGIRNGVSIAQNIRMAKPNQYEKTPNEARRETQVGMNTYNRGMELARVGLSAIFKGGSTKE